MFFSSTPRTPRTDADVDAEFGKEVANKLRAFAVLYRCPVYQDLGQRTRERLLFLQWLVRSGRLTP